MAESVVAPIPDAIKRGIPRVLPDRVIVVLDPADNVACPVCRQAKAFFVLVQDIDGPAPTWSYRCFTCPAPVAPALAA